MTSPAAVLAEVERLEGDGIPSVALASAKVGRVTGWVIVCSACGTPGDGAGGALSLPSKKMARGAAEVHIRAAHGNIGRIRDRG